MGGGLGTIHLVGGVEGQNGEGEVLGVWIGRWTEWAGVSRKGRDGYRLFLALGQIGSYSVLPLSAELVGNIWAESIWSQTGSIDWLLRYGHYNISAKVALVACILETQRP